MIHEEQQQVIPCRECGEALEQVDWTGFHTTIVTCLNRQCRLFGFTFTLPTYADKDLTDYLDSRDICEEREIDVTCPDCRYYPVHVESGAWARCPKCNKSIW